MIDPYRAKENFGKDFDWATADFHALNSSQVEQVIAAADADNYRKPKNANGSRARYYFYAVQRKLRR